jgi:hypothetical protein
MHANAEGDEDQEEREDDLEEASGHEDLEEACRCSVKDADDAENQEGQTSREDPKGQGERLCACAKGSEKQ